MSVYLNFDVFELYTHTYISCTLADNTSRHCTHRWVAQSKSDRFHFVRIRVWLWGFGSSPGLKIGVLASFFFSLRSFWFIRGVFLFRFRRCWKRCLWNFAALAYQMEPSLLYRATWLGWPGLTSRQLRWGWSWRGPSASVDAAQLWWCAAWLTDTVWGRGLLTLRLRPRESPGGGHVLWITEADFGFNHETVNRHLLIPPKKKPKTNWPWIRILDTQMQIISHLVSFQY